MPPFIIYGMPRSRTAWLSAFLTYRDWICTHEQAVTMRRFDDVRWLFSRPRFGTVETGSGPGAELLRAVVPDIREAVVYRPIDEVMESFRAIDVSAVAVYDWPKLQRILDYQRRCLDKIAARPGVLVIQHADLVREETCKAVFEHCLPYPFDRQWWSVLDQQNIQVDVADHLRYCLLHRPEIDAFKQECKDMLRAFVRSGAITRKAA